MSPLVSIVVTGDGETRGANASIESALAQTYPRVEVVVAGVGTEPARDPELSGRSPSRGILFVPEAQATLAAARNAGVAASAGVLVVLLPSGARLAPRMVETLASRLLAGDPWTFAYSDYRRVGAGGEEIPADDYAIARVRHVLEGDLLPGLLPAPYFPIACALLPRALLDGLGGFDPRFEGRDDHHFLLRACCEGARARCVDEPLAIVEARATEEGETDTAAGRSSARALLADVAARYPEAVVAAFGRMFLEASRETDAIWRDGRDRLARLESRARRLELAVAERRQRRVESARPSRSGAPT